MNEKGGGGFKKWKHFRPSDLRMINAGDLIAGSHWQRSKGKVMRKSVVAIKRGR